MPRSALWKTIAETLAADLAAGRYAPGARLPSEAELAARFGVNRHTVRHALSALSDAGSIHTRRGAGAYVLASPADYALGRRVRFHQNVAASGRTASRRFTRMETVPASQQEAEVLDLPEGTLVHVVEGISLADDQPLAAFRSVFPADRLAGFLPQLERLGSITAALAVCGIADYMRRHTRITAKLARPVLALALKIPEGAPILRSVAVNADPEGRPIEFGTTWFAGDRVTLTVQPETDR